jgi:uncharacterized OB-fold protein
MTTSKSKSIPVLEKSWTTPSSPQEKPQLIGSECPSCGEVYFPRKVKKLCSHCQYEGLKDIKLSRRGKLDSFTILMQQPGGGYYVGPVPYAIGIVKLPDGVFIETLLKTEKLEDLYIGQTMELLIEPVWEDPNGVELTGFKFQPVK